MTFLPLVACFLRLAEALVFLNNTFNKLVCIYDFNFNCKRYYRQTIHQHPWDTEMGLKFEACHAWKRPFKLRMDTQLLPEDEKPITNQIALSTAQRIYQEQGFVLAKAATLNEAKVLVELIIGTSNKFPYASFGILEKRIEDQVSNPKCEWMNNYADAPSVPTLPHNEVGYSLNVPNHFIFYVEIPALVGGTSQLWDSVKLCGKIQARLPRLWDEYIQYGLEHCQFYPDENMECGRAALEAWIGPGINMYSKSLQKVFGLSRMGTLPTGVSPYVVWSWRDCGIQKCTRTRGIVEHSHGLACVNQFGVWSPKNFYNYNLTLAMHPYRVQLGNGRNISEEEWRVIYSIWEDQSFEIKLDAMDVLIVNNIRFAHGRTAYFGGQRSTKLLLYGEVSNLPNDVI